MARALLLLALFLSTASGAKWINSFAGPFIAVLGRFLECSHTQSEHLVRANLKATQYRNRQVEAQNQLQKLSGNVSVEIPLTNKGTMSMKVASRSNNQWKENAHVLKFPYGICRSMYEYMPDFTRQIYQIEQEDTRKHCVIPKGLYVVNEAPVNLSVPGMTVFPYGTWRLEVVYEMGSEARPRNIMCLMMELYTVPKL